MSKRKTYKDILDKPYCDPTKRMDFILYFEVEQGNPNGDPDAGNLPRLDPTDNHGIVTDVSTKRKIRDYFQAALERPIFIQNKTALNTLYFKTARGTDSTESKLSSKDKDAIKSLAVFLKPSEKKDQPYDKFLGEKVKLATEGNDALEEENLEWLSEFELMNVEFEPDTQILSYLGESKDAKKIAEEIIGESDLSEEIKAAIRKPKTGLAALIANAKKKVGKLGREGLEAMKRAMCQEFDDIRLFGAVLTAGTNAGQIRGPMQLTFGRSLQPIIPIEASITRVAITRASDFLKKQTEMGRKPFVSWAVYEQHGFYNAPLGAPADKNGTGITKDDLARFWEAIANMFPEAKSAANGLMNVCELIVFVHDDEKGRGCAPFHKLKEKVRLIEREGITEMTKGFSKKYADVKIDSEDKINEAGITIWRPLQDLWPGL